jgi:hypothetical protein
MIERTRSSALRRRRQYAPLAIAAVAGAIACSPDSASAPTAPPPPAATAAPAPRALLGLDPLVSTTTTLVTGTVTTLDNTVSSLLGLLNTCSQQDQLKAGKYIGIYGGSITVGDHKLTVPAGALSQTVYITATQQSGTVVEIDFQPHGLKFAKPATLTLDYGSCSTPSGSAQSIVYVNDSNQIVEVRPSSDNTSSDVVSAPINHFSGYAVATTKTE